MGSPRAIFKRLILLASGQVVEDIDYYNRVHEMMHTLTSGDSRLNDFGEGFGQPATTPLTLNLGTATTVAAGGIPIGKSQTVVFKPLSGLLNQNKYLPIR